MGILIPPSAGFVVYRAPDKAPQSSNAVPVAQGVKSLGRAGWIISIICLTIGGIYFGVFSAVEAAGIGALLALLVTIIRKALTWENIKDVFASTLRATGTLFLILFGAFVFKTFVGFTGVAFSIADWVAAQGFSGMLICIILIVIFPQIALYLPETKFQ